MSYILEALRRSQAERERGRVPGLDTQLAPSGDKPGKTRPPVPWLWLGASLGAVLLLAVAVVAWRMGGPAAMPVAVELPPPQIQPQPQVPAPTPAAPAAPATRALPPAVEPRPPLPVVVSAPTVAPTPSRAVPPAPAPATPPATAPTTAAAAAAEPRPIPLGQLSAEQRRELPPMAIGGAIWSENAASRFIMVNGQVVHEGEAAGPGVTVERIGQKAAVLRWRDLRIEAPF